MMCYTLQYDTQSCNAVIAFYIFWYNNTIDMTIADALCIFFIFYISPSISILCQNIKKHCFCNQNLYVTIHNYAEL